MRYVIGVAFAAVLLIGACAGGDDSTSQAEEEVEDLQQQLDDLESSLEEGSAVDGPTDEAAGGGAAPAPSGPRKCSELVSVNENTSCPFALNVADSLYAAGGVDPSFDVYSAVTDQTYTMQCDTDLDPVECRGGNNALVYVSWP